METTNINYSNKFMIYLVVIIISFGSAISQNTNNSNNNQSDITDRNSLGVYLGANMYSPSFAPDASINGLNFNTSNNGFDFNAGIIGNFPITNKLTISGLIGYNGLSGNVQQTAMDTNYKFTASLAYLEISPVLKAKDLILSKNLYFLAGLEFGIPISNKYTLTNSTSSKDIQSNADLSNAATRFALSIGAGYNIPVSKNIYLSPEISYRIPFNNVSSNSSFSTLNIPQLRAGISLNFALSGEKELAMKENTPDNNLDVTMKDILGHNPNGDTYPLKSIKVEETKYKELIPLLPYVFFDENKWEPSSSYIMQSNNPSNGKGFEINSIKPDAMKINSHVIDILGKRMNDLNYADLTITGTNDGKNEIKEKDLSEKRANFISNYLEKNYNINPNRIHLSYRNLPDKPSTDNVEDGIIENRRAEFSSSTPELLYPIEHLDSLQRIATPHLVDFIPVIKSNKTIKNWNMSIYQGSKNVAEIKGADIPNKISWVVQPNSLEQSELPAEWTLKISDIDGKSKSINGTIPIDYLNQARVNEQKLPDKTVYKFSLVLFDFDKHELTKENSEILNKMVLPVINFKSKVKIYGYTDRIGTPEHNEKLSTDRANEVKKFLESKIKCSYEFFGLGETNELFDNNTPTGRQLSRTVQIVVETPNE